MTTAPTPSHGAPIPTLGGSATEIGAGALYPPGIRLVALATYHPLVLLGLALVIIGTSGSNEIFEAAGLALFSTGVLPQLYVIFWSAAWLRSRRGVRTRCRGPSALDSASPAAGTAQGAPSTALAAGG